MKTPFTPDLFSDAEAAADPAGARGTVSRIERIGPGAVVLRGLARPRGREILDAVHRVERSAPWRRFVTARGHQMSVEMTNCGSLGWTSDRRGYRYTSVDPLSGMAWPAMPAALLDLATQASDAAGYPDFTPDGCLINRYAPGSRLSLHQDRDEADYDAPIVSVSLGVPAVFQFGGMQRTDHPVRIPLLHGDVVVWGGVDRLRYHGVLPLKAASHPLLGEHRINLTFRKAG